MDISFKIILAGALLLLISILATTFSARIGMPILLAFLGIGVLGGTESIGKIVFTDIQNAHLIGSLALAVILFDAGLHTKFSTLRAGLWPALSLAVIGIMVTTMIVSVFAVWLMHLTWPEGFLLGAIISPTDAAAVFVLLHATRLMFNKRLVATLEIESGSNDPLAVFLTASVAESLLSGKTLLPLYLLKTLTMQFAIGGLIAVVASKLLVRLCNAIKLSTGLYPLLILSGGLSIFAITNLLRGSGYLATYIAGIIIGNNLLSERENILRTHDSLAWLGQISMFLMFGLLVKPSALFPISLQAILVACALILIARPVAVWLSLLPFHFNWREKVFIAWVGLRGAVPIILTFTPLLMGLNNATLFFNVTFFIVVISIALQGWSLTTVARWLKLNNH